MSFASLQGLESSQRVLDTQELWQHDFLISVEKIPSPPQQHHLFRDQAWFYNEIHKSLNNYLRWEGHVTVTVKNNFKSYQQFIAIFTKC